MNSLRFLLLLVALLLPACMPLQPGQPTIPSDNQQVNLANSKWLLESFGEHGAEALVINGSSITLELKGNGHAEGHSVCNSYGGSYALQDGKIRFEEIVSTLIACEDEAVNHQEQEYLSALRTAGRFMVADDRLVIWYGDDQNVLNFVRIPASRPSSSFTSAPKPTTEAIPGKDEGARIEFPPGQTSAEVFAELAAGATDSYIVYGQEGETMSIEITSPNNDVLLSVVTEDGTPLKRYQNGLSSWTGELPATQDYVLQAVSAGQPTSYTLWVSIDPLTSQGSKHVEFEPGATTATRRGNLAEGGKKEYVLSASAGQRMQVQMVGYSAPFHFTLTSPSSETVLNSSDDNSGAGKLPASENYVFAAQVILPEDGDYVVRLSVPPGIGSTRYDVTFTIDNYPLSTFP
jgi:heat shock protein HslJ